MWQFEFGLGDFNSDGVRDLVCWTPNWKLDGQLSEGDPAQDVELRAFSGHDGKLLWNRDVHCGAGRGHPSILNRCRAWCVADLDQDAF